jgi:hypothetical protein
MSALVSASSRADKPQKYTPSVTEMYKATLEVRSGTTISTKLETHLPDSYSLDLGTTWNNPFDQPLSQLLGGNEAVNQIGTAVKGGTGQTTQTKWMSVAVWGQGSMMTVTIPFKFVAFTDAKKEVLLPIRRLMELLCPSEGVGASLIAPGPRINGADWRNPMGDVITLRIGTHFVMSPCIIENVAQSLDTQYDQNGVPISAAVDVTFKSYFTVTREDVVKMYSQQLGEYPADVPVIIRK